MRIYGYKHAYIHAHINALNHTPFTRVFTQLRRSRAHFARIFTQLRRSRVLVACALVACITGCLCFGCVYNWLPVLALPVQPQQPVIQAIQPSTGNQLYRQPKHRQPVIQAAQAQATSYTGSASTGNQLYTQRKHRQRKHRQPVIQAAQAQATSYTGSASTGNQLYTW